MTMQTVDRSRAGGRVNLVDAAAALLILVLIPMAYGAYLLFRTPPAKFPPRISAPGLWEPEDPETDRVAADFADALLDGIGQRMYLFEAGGPRHGDGGVHEVTVAVVVPNFIA